MAVGGLAVFGLGVAAAGLLRADPAEGFPVGTPDGSPASVTWHGFGHLAAGGVGLLLRVSQGQEKPAGRGIGPLSSSASLTYVRTSRT